MVAKFLQLFLIKGGGALRKKVTTYIDGWAKPQWFVGMPLGHQPQGGMSAICVTSVGAIDPKYGNTSSCDAPEHVALSGISMQAWEGGNMPETEEKVYAYVQSKSGFTMLFFTILTFAVTWGLSSAFTTAMGNAAFGSGLSSLSIGAIGAGIYAGVNLLSGTNFNTVQSGWAGSSGDGVLRVNTGTMDQHQKGLVQGVKNQQIVSRVGQGLAGAKAFYSGTCPEDKTVADCNTLGLDPGTMYRPDSFAETNTTLILQSQKQKCESMIPPAQVTAALTDPVLKEQLRLWVQQCASPQNGTWDTGW